MISIVSLQFLNATFKFVINFMDTFIILVSFGLSQRFQQFATRVLRLQNRVRFSETLLNFFSLNTISFCRMFPTLCGTSCACIIYFCAN